MLQISRRAAGYLPISCLENVAVGSQLALAGISFEEYRRKLDTETLACTAGKQNGTNVVPD